MVQSFTTTLSADELTAIIEGAINKAICQLPDPPKTKGIPITRRELMNRLNISEPTVIRWQRKGVIPCMHIGSAVRYDWEAVLKSLENKKGVKK